MFNLIADGNVATITAAADIASGDVVIVGGLIGIAVTDIAEDETGAINLKGAYTVAKTTGEAFSQGDRLYYDTDTLKTTKVVTADTIYIGKAFADALSADTTSVVLLERDADVFGGVVIDPQSSPGLVGTQTVADATGNTTGDINGIKDAIMTDLNAVGGKLDVLLGLLFDAGVLV